MTENQKIDNHNLYYLKVVPLREVSILEADKSVKNYLQNIFYVENEQDFGFLKEIIRLDKSRVYQFIPFSKDRGISYAKYETQQEALESVIHFFNKAGFRAIPFDLEKIVETIR